MGGKKLDEKVKQKLDKNAKSIAAKTGKKEGEEVSLYDAFVMYDTTGDGMIDYYEYRDLLIKLDLDLSEDNKRRLFCEVDVNNTGTLEFSEFEEIMQLLKEKQKQQAMEKMGFTEENLIIALVIFAIWLILLIVFLLVGVSAFTNGQDFGACINALMTGGAAASSTAGSKDKPDEAQLDETIESAL